MYTYFSAAGRLFAAPTAQIHTLRRPSRAAGSDADLTVDLRAWLSGSTGADYKIISVPVGSREVEIRVDAIHDLDAPTTPILALPSLVTAAGYDPAVRGVIIYEAALALVLDLELVAQRAKSAESAITEDE